MKAYVGVPSLQRSVFDVKVPLTTCNTGGNKDGSRRQSSTVNWKFEFSYYFILLFIEAKTEREFIEAKPDQTH